MSKLLGLLAINNSAARSNGLMLVARNCRQSYLVRSLVTSSSKVEAKNKPIVLGLWKRFLASHKPVEQSPSKSSSQAESEWERSTRYVLHSSIIYTFLISLLYIEREREREIKIQFQSIY